MANTKPVGVAYSDPELVAGTTITGATIANPTITGATLTGGAFNGTVGATTPAAGSFTTLAASGAVSGAGVTALFASPPAVGGTAPAAGAFTTLSSTGQTDLQGTVAGTAAAAGKVGQVLSSTVVVGTPVSLTTATPANMTSLSLTAGDWLVDVTCDYVLGAATTTDWKIGVSTTTATFGAQGTFVSQPLVLTTHTDTYELASPSVEINVSTTTTVYAVANATFSAGTVGVAGVLTARRIR